MKVSVLLLSLFSLLPCFAFSQAPDTARLDVGLVPWTRGISAGFSIWPTSKERVRLGYHWEAKPNQQWVHELAYINALHAIVLFGVDPERPGFLEGVQLRNELRFYHRRSGPSFWYHGLGLAYMYSEHSVEKGMDCDEWGECAYFRRFDPLIAHTNTLTFNWGLMLNTDGALNFDVFTSFGLRGTYFPQLASKHHFGRGPLDLLVDREHFILHPYARLGVNLMFSISKRKETAANLQNR